MNVLDMVKQDTDSVIGLTLILDLGGSKPIVGQVKALKKNEWNNLIDGEMSTWYSYSVSFEGAGYYTIDSFTKVVDLV